MNSPRRRLGGSKKTSKAPKTTKGTYVQDSLQVETSQPVAATFDSLGPTKPIIQQRTVKVTQLAYPGLCLGYNASLQSPIRMYPCSSEGRNDWWDILQISVDQFKLRHNSSQLCIPENPEIPVDPFDCFVSRGTSVATADSINGLVDCNNPYAAPFSYAILGDTLSLFNHQCSVMGHNITLMSYHKTQNEVDILWGEQILISMEHKLGDVQGLFAEWIFTDVST